MLLSGVSLGSMVFQALEGIGSSRSHGVQSEFQQLGQDLQSGSLTAAQSDYAALTSYFSSTQQTSDGSSLSQEFTALGQAIQTGNLSVAQSAYNTLQQDMPQVATQAHSHHHHHSGSSSQTANASTLSTLTHGFISLGQSLQSGSHSAAETAYTTLQQDLTQLGRSGAQSITGQVSLAG